MNLICTISFLLIFPVLANSKITSSEVNFAQSNEDSAVTRLRSYLRINTEQPHPDAGYEKAIEWLQWEAEDIGLEFDVLDMEAPNLFAVCITWKGMNSSLKSIMLNSHMDTVASDASKWTYPPYNAEKDSDGNIYARGAADMKSRTVATLEALRKLKTMGFQPLRSIHVIVMPDEELGGIRGMMPFVQTQYFKNLNVGVDFDEGGYLNETSRSIYFSIAEKNAWKFNITAKGLSGHGASFPQFTASQRLQIVIDRLMSFRQAQYKLLVEGKSKFEDLTTINLVRLGGGFSDNVIPDEVWTSFDMRIMLRDDLKFEDLDNMLNNIIAEANTASSDLNNTVSINFLIKSLETGRTTANSSNPWWNVLQNLCQTLKYECKTRAVIPAASDARFVRNVGIPAFGFAPFPPGRAHKPDEFVNEKDFLKAIQMYVEFIKVFGMQSAEIAE